MNQTSDYQGLKHGINTFFTSSIHLQIEIDNLLVNVNRPIELYRSIDEG